MIRLASALVLLTVVLGIVWFLPPIATVGLGAIVLILTFLEYANLARQRSPDAPMPAAGCGAVIVYAAVNAGVPLTDVVVPVLLALALFAVARGRPEEDVLRAVSVSVLPVLYLGLSLGLVVLVRTMNGPEAALFPMLVVAASDSAQYYGGRTMGRHLLAPAISPKKTVEGAIAGLIGAMIAAPLLGAWAFPGRPAFAFVVLGLLLGAIGVCGDLFESLLKRSAGVKDASGLIPGHGGMLDRIDALLFAGPVYYLFVRYAGW